MALLHYANLVDHRPGILLSRTFYGLRPFHQFLQRTQKYLESDAAVQRLDWETSPPTTNKNSRKPKKEQSTKPEEYWLLLKEPKDRPNEPEATFREFLDENTSEVYFSQINQDSDSKQPSRYPFNDVNKAAIIGRDPRNNRLRLDTMPKPGQQLLIRPNTYVLNRQRRALETLQDQPDKQHLPLLRLNESSRHARWPIVEPSHVDSWKVLTDGDRPGSDEQRQFIQIALATPDFALLEGPPGSGKTTVICELILQLAEQGKRVLLCGSTHVAVDNVLERLMADQNRDLVIPVRIGERHSISEKVQPWQLQQFVRTERKRLRDELNAVATPSASQQYLYDSIRHDSGKGVIERMVLDAANVVCGTTIGILQHPDIKSRTAATPQFDVLIIDEASKTTFQEFLVPALYAKRWVLVGDPKQLSPYVDDAALASNLKPCLAQQEHRNACIDVFKAGQQQEQQRRVAVIADEKPETLELYRQQATENNVDIATAGQDPDLWSARMVIGTPEAIDSSMNELPLDAATIRATGAKTNDQLIRRSIAWLHKNKRANEQTPIWEDELAWRLARQYEHRFAISNDDSKRATTAEQLQTAIDKLMPANGKATESVNQVRRIALPSVLESLQQGFERSERDRDGSALTDGLPSFALQQRHVLLSAQHRMHPEIAAFSHQHVYGGEALHSPPALTQTRQWGYLPNKPRGVWLDVAGKMNRKLNENQQEANAVLDTLKHFDKWAERNPANTGAWEVAILTFYRGQERLVRSVLQKWTKQRSLRSYFRGTANNPYLTIELCTVDRFQGHEADLVILSLANDHATSFLESPNRLNVALTRARYQRILIGNRHKMQNTRPGLLQRLANDEPWNRSIEQLGENA